MSYIQSIVYNGWIPKSVIRQDSTSLLEIDFNQLNSFPGFWSKQIRISRSSVKEDPRSLKNHGAPSQHEAISQPCHPKFADCLLNHSSCCLQQKLELVLLNCHRDNEHKRCERWMSRCVRELVMCHESEKHHQHMDHQWYHHQQKIHLACLTDNQWSCHTHYCMHHCLGRVCLQSLHTNHRWWTTNSWRTSNIDPKELKCHEIRPEDFRRHHEVEAYVYNVANCTNISKLKHSAVALCFMG